MLALTEWKKARRKSINNRELLVAVCENNLEETNFLLNTGTDSNFRDVDGCTPLSLAAQYGSAEVVKLLLDKGASLETKDFNNETPLDIAKRLNRYEIIRILATSADHDLLSEISDADDSSKSAQNRNEIKILVDNDKNDIWNNAVHGNIYQIKVLMLFLYRGVTCKYSFRLGTEIKEARKFDDLVFEYTQNNTKVYRLLQAKHKIDESKKITVHKLLSETNGDYSLVKYFHSYQACKGDNYFKDGSIKDVTICTNIDFDFNDLEKANIKVVKFEEKDDILDVESKSKKPMRYKFTSDVVSKLQKKLGLKKYNLNTKSVETEIEDFLDHLVFAVNQPNEGELGEIIKKEIGKEADASMTETMYNKFFIRMLDCFKGRSNFMSFDEGKKLFEEFKKSFFIWFNVHDPVKSFTGRLKLMKNIHKLLQTQDNRTLCISGLGGVGKSEFVKKYISEYSKCYDNKVIWINAESYQALLNSFRQLASDKLDISTTNADGKEKDINSIISQVYQYFSKSKSLFIFDNAEMYRSSNKFDSGISQFLPSLPSGCNKPYIIITSRNQKWPESVKIAVLNGFTEKESVTFICKNLNLKIDSQNEHVKQLGLKLQFLPLALQQAVAYIKSQNEDLSKVGKGFKISDYLEKFAGKSKEILNFEFPNHSDNKYTKTVFTTWNVTLDAMNKNEDGHDALTMLNIIAYLLPNDISEETLLGFIQSDEKLQSSIKLLKQYSLIEIQNKMLSIHRLIQQVTRMRLDEKNQEKEILERCLAVINKYTVNSKNIDHFLSIWKYCQKYPILLKQHALQLSHIIGELNFCGRNEEACSIGATLTDILKESSKKDLDAQELLSTVRNNYGGAIMGQGEYEKALKEFEQSYEINKTLRGPYDQGTLGAKSNIAGAILNIGREDEAFKCFQEVLKDSQLYLGENHYQTLTAKANVAHFLIEKGNCTEALSMLQDTYTKFANMLGTNHEKTLVVKYNIAYALSKTNKIEEALKIYQEIYDYQKNNLVENHPETLATRSSIAGLLHNQGQKKAALEIYSDLFKIYSKIFGENHPKTVEIHGEMAYVLVELDKFEEATHIFQDVFIKQKGLFGLNHPHTERTLSGLAAVLRYLGKDTESLKAHEELLRCQQSLFGIKDVRTLKSRIVIAFALMNGKKYDAAYKQYSEIYEIEKNSFGMNDPRPLMSRHQMGMIYFFKKQYDKALSTLREVCEAQEAVLGKNDTVCVNTRYNIAAVTMEQKMYKIQHKILNIPPLKVTDPIKAVKHNELRILEKLIKEGADINTEDVNKGTLLHHAVNLDLTNIIEFLLKNGADVTRTTVKGNTPLHMATSKGAFEVVKDLLENVDHGKLQTFIDAKTAKSGSSALHIAAKNGFFEITKYLLTHGATYDLKNNDNQLPSVDLTTDRYVKNTLKNVANLFEFANTGNKELINTLQQYSVDEYLLSVNARNKLGYNLMQVAVSNNDQDLVNSFHNMRNNRFQSIYIMIVTSDNLNDLFSLANEAFVATQLVVHSLDEVLIRVRDFVQMFRSHCNSKPNPNIATIEDMIGLFDSSTSSRTFAELGRHVFANHLVLFISSIYTTHFLKAAKSNDLTEVGELLTNFKSVNVNVNDNDGWTPLHYAINANNKQMVLMLLCRGAQLNCATNADKLTPLHIATSKGNAEIVNILMHYVSNNELIDAKTKKNGSTALHIAVKNGQFEVTKLLFAHCANYQMKNNDGQVPADLINNEEIRGLFKFIDELFVDVANGNIKVIEKLKVLNYGMLLTAVRVRNCNGHALMEVAALNQHSEIHSKIYEMFKAAIKERKSRN